MSIVVTKGKVIEQLQYNKVYMKSLVITQQPTDNESDIPEYRVKILSRLYATDSSGKKYYDSILKNVDIEDYLALAMKKAQDGDPDLLNALGAIEKALSSILTDLREFGDAEVV